MNYARITNNTFSTKGKIVTHKKISEEFRERLDYFVNHRFIVDVDPLDGSCKLEVREKEER